MSIPWKVLFAVAVLAICSAIVVSDVSDADGEMTVYGQTNASVVQGNSAYCYVYVSSLSRVASLSIEVHYDPSVIEVSSHYNNASATIYDGRSSAGSLNYSYIFEESSDESPVLLFYFCYNISTDTNPGPYFFDIIVGDAYDSGLDPVDITGTRCNFSVEESQGSERTCSIWGDGDVNTSINGEFNLNYYLSDTSLLSGSVNITYDSELFEFISYQNGDFLDGKIVDTNTGLTGSVYLSFVSTETASSSHFITLKFRTLVNTDISSTISFNVSDFYDGSLNPVLCNGYDSTVRISIDPTYVADKPSVITDALYDVETDTVTITVTLGEGTHLGAGDFVISFNTNELTYVSSERQFNPSYFIINNKNASQGQLKFSIISLTDVTDRTVALTAVFAVTHGCTDRSSTIGLTGTGITDSMTEPIILNIQGTNATIPLRHIMEEWTVVTEPTCTDSGIERRVCVNCEGNEEIREISALGHSWVSATYEWSADAKECTIHITCGNDSSHHHDIAGVQSVASVKVAPTTSSMGTTAYSVSGTYGGFAYSNIIELKDIPALEPEISQKESEGATTYTNTVTENQTTQVTDIFATAKSNNATVEITVPTATIEVPVTISFDIEAVNAIGGNDMTISVEVIENSTQMEDAELIVDVKLLGATFIEGKAKVTVPLNESVPSGKTVKVYFIDGDTRVDMNAAVIDGKVVFETNHFSTYAVIFEDAPSSDKKGGEFPIIPIVLGAVAILALVGVTFFVIRKRA